MMTGTTALVIGGELVVANVGDSNAVRLRAAGPDAERRAQAERPRAHAYRVDGRRAVISRQGSIARVQGSSRSVGHSATSIWSRTSPPSRPARAWTRGWGGSGAEFLILACDGVWDVLNAHQACTEVRKAVAAQGTMEAAAVALCEQSLARGSTDNISVVVVDLRAELGQRAGQPIEHPQQQPKQPAWAYGRLGGSGLERVGPQPPRAPGSGRWSADARGCGRAGGEGAAS